MNSQLFVLNDVVLLQQHLAQHYELLQIVRDSQGEETWQENVSANTRPLYGHSHLPLVSAKGFFFAQNEALYEFDGETFAPITPILSPRALFGVQACDLTAISYQDQFFKDDPYYQARREKSLLVGIDCSAPCEKGFCPLVNAGPQVATEHADLILSNFPHGPQDSLQDDLEGPWLLIATSVKGLDSLQGLELENAPDHWPQLRSEFKAQVVDEFADFSYITNSIKYINDGLVPAQLWEALSVRCLACSGCTSLCPTCSCYSSYEQTAIESNKQTTVRTWDSCQFDGFQREASGHNPSHLAGQRTERFWFHKFSDDYLPEFERYGCVGCGRCEQTCPGSIGVHTVMRRIEQQCCN
ncbi:MAG: sulfhydrogenase subunit beta (sulfur reductase) [Paraglaciecola sp.]|jgi:sulfhydrogenase subunit beta (sulfur reductase)